MLEQLQAKIDETLHKELKIFCYARQLEAIDHLVRQIQKEYPDFIPDNLATRLSGLAEKSSEQEAESIVKLKKDIANIVKEEIDLFKQVKVAA